MLGLVQTCSKNLILNKKKYFICSRKFVMRSISYILKRWFRKFCSKIQALRILENFERFPKRINQKSHVNNMGVHLITIKAQLAYITLKTRNTNYWAE